MSIKQEPGKAVAGPGPSGLRRRIVLELTVDELPLMEAAETRHGSKRGALLAALASEARVEELEQELARVARDLAAGRKQAQRSSRATAKDAEALGHELKDARASLARAERDLAKALQDAARSEAQLSEAQDRRQALIAEREQEIAELSGRAFGHLYCGRCQDWAPEAEWAWAKDEHGDEYAYHQPCGDHGPSLLGGNSSWLGA